MRRLCPNDTESRLFKDRRTFRLAARSSIRSVGEAEDSNAAPIQAAAEPAPAAAPASAEVLPVVAQPLITSTKTYDWEKESRIYKITGWRLFGGGLFLNFILAPAVVLGETYRSFKGENVGDAGAISFFCMEALGGAMIITGISLLIAEAVKINPCHSSEIAGLRFEWNPEVYASPEFSGIGFSARF